MFVRLALLCSLWAVCGCSDASTNGPTRKCGSPGDICHLVGTGQGEFNGDGLPPQKTALRLPSVVRVGPEGDWYVMDNDNYRLRRDVDGAIVTVAGNGVHAYASVGNKAVDSPLENPFDVAFSKDGLPIFVSLHDPRVLRIDVDGTLVAIAGTGDIGDSGDEGPAESATFKELSGITIAPDGSIFVSDDLANRVRVIRPDGTIHTYAGDGVEGYDGDQVPATAAALFHPEELSLDAEGNLYVADTYNHRIRRIDGATGMIDTVAGTGTRGLSGDGGPAVDAELQYPSGVTVAPDGQVYIADSFNHRIRRIDPSGVITTVVGTTEGYSGDNGPANHAKLKGPAYLEATDELLYIADMRNQVVRVAHLPLP